jgi:hypothetical protein
MGRGKLLLAVKQEGVSGRRARARASCNFACGDGGWAEQLIRIDGDGNHWFPPMLCGPFPCVSVLESTPFLEVEIVSIFYLLSLH